MNKLFKSSGYLHYDKDNLLRYKLVLSVDQEIIRYYRYLLPNSFALNSQMYDGHISVVRKEVPLNMEFWGKYENELVEFEYSHAMRNGAIYFWIDVFSKRLEEIREELGLPICSPYILPPEGYRHCFHATIGNIKEIQQTKPSS